jgi:hypothetical protein
MNLEMTDTYKEINKDSQGTTSNTSNANIFLQILSS